MITHMSKRTMEFLQKMSLVGPVKIHFIKMHNKINQCEDLRVKTLTIPKHSKMKYILINLSKGLFKKLMLVFIQPSDEFLSEILVFQPSISDTTEIIPKRIREKVELTVNRSATIKPISFSDISKEIHNYFMSIPENTMFWIPTHNTLALKYTTAAVILIRSSGFTGEKQVLCVQGNQRKAYEWSFPGGKRNYGEIPSMTAMREFQEETSYELNFDGIYCRTIFTYLMMHDYWPGHLAVVYAIFFDSDIYPHGEIKSGRLHENHEIHQIKWISINTLRATVEDRNDTSPYRFRACAKRQLAQLTDWLSGSLPEVYHY